MKLSLNAKILRIVLLVTVVLLAVGTVAGFIFTRKELQEFATSISQTESDAAAVDDNVATYKQLEEALKTTQDIKAKADSIAVPSTDYPVAVIANITDIAQRAGVGLSSVSYGDNTSGSAQQPNSGTTATPQTPAGAPAPTPTTAPSPSGATKKTISVTLASPVSYSAFMSFLRGIETDEVYMHIAKISMTKADGENISVQPLTIEVYVR